MSWYDPRNWGKTAVRATGNFLYDVTGADNYMQAYRDARKGNWGGAAFNLAQGLGETALLAAPAAGSATRIGRLATAIPGRTGTITRAVTGIGGSGGIRPVFSRLGFNAGVRGASGFLTRPRGAVVAAPVAVPQMGQAVEERRFAGIQSRLPVPAAAVGGAGGRGGQGGRRGGRGGGGGAVDSSYSGDIFSPEALAERENAAAAVPQLEALSPKEYADLLNAARDAERGYGETINRIGRETATAERSLSDYIRGVGREVAGGRQDVSSALAQLGRDTSPATAAYADYLSGMGAGRVAAARGQMAELLGSLREQRAQAEALRMQQLADLERQRVARQAQATVGRAVNFVS